MSTSASLAAVHAPLLVLRTYILTLPLGPAGLAAAIRLKQLANAADNPDFRVLLLEKGSSIGAHIVSGNVMDPCGLNELLPDWLAPDNPNRFEHATPVTANRVRFLTKNRSVYVPVPPPLANAGNYIISLSELCGWLGERAEELGVEVYPGFAASEVLYGNDGAVAGVATNDVGIARDGKPKPSFERGMAFRARATLFAEGAHGSLTKQVTKKYDLRRDCQHATYALGLKEVWEVPPEKFEKGAVLHTFGHPLPYDTYGGGWAYHFGDNLVSVGLVVGLDYPNPWLSPYGEFQKLKHHPLFADVLRGGKCVSYAARVLNEGGFQSIPRVAFPGGALVGDSAGFLNVPRIKGSHNALRTGRMAAEATYNALASPKQEVAEGEEKEKREDSVFLYDYEDALRASPVWTELHRARNMRPAMHSPLGLYGMMLYTAADSFLLRGRAPWTLKHATRDHVATQPADEYPKIEYPKPDGELSFDILTSVSRTGTNHEEDQPVHLRVPDWKKHAAEEWPRFKGLENRFCPAGVYEYIEDPESEVGQRFQINAQK